MTTSEIDPYYVALDETIPACGRTAFTVSAGQVLRVIDLEGQQVADLICFAAADYADKLSVHNTLLLNRTVYITTGHRLVSTACTTLMTIIADTVGVHDLIAGSCSAESNAVRYGVRGTASCRRNFEEALAPHGIPLREIPYSFNIFMNVPVTDQETMIVEPVSKPGDYIDLRAEADLLVAISNCPQRRNPCNAYNPTPMQVVVHEAAPLERPVATSAEHGLAARTAQPGAAAAAD